MPVGTSLPQPMPRFCATVPGYDKTAKRWDPDRFNDPRTGQEDRFARKARDFFADIATQKYIFTDIMTDTPDRIHFQLEREPSAQGAPATTNVIQLTVTEADSGYAYSRPLDNVDFQQPKAAWQKVKEALTEVILRSRALVADQAPLDELAKRLQKA